MQIKRIDYSDNFKKDLKKSPLKIKIAFRERIRIFSENKFSSELKNHKLTGKYKGYRSFNVTGDWRAIFREYDGGKVVYFDLLGNHSKLYR